MQRIIIDTNVLVSSLIQEGFPFLILDFAITSQDIQICISEVLLSEYIEVLRRKKFQRYSNFALKAELFLNILPEQAQLFFPTVHLNIIADPADNRLLELAESCGADFLITGNRTHFTMEFYKATRIVSPKDYWLQYLP